MLGQFVTVDIEARPSIFCHHGTAIFMPVMRLR